MSCRTLQRPPPEIDTLVRVEGVASKIVMVEEDDPPALSFTFEAAAAAAKTPLAPPPIMAILGPPVGLVGWEFLAVDRRSELLRGDLRE